MGDENGFKMTIVFLIGGFVFLIRTEATSFKPTTYDVEEVNSRMLDMKLVTSAKLSIECSHKCAVLFGKKNNVVQKFEKSSERCSCYMAEELFIFTDSGKVDGVVYSYERK